MKNIHVLPTDKPSRLWFYKQFAHLLTGLTVEKSKDIHPQHIYITSDEEIKEGDYIFETDNNITNIADKDYYRNEFDFKIILTTDQDLIKDGVQAIPDEFFEWFVKNPSCEKVIVEEEDYSQKCKECGETVKRGYNCTKKCFMKSGNFILTDKNIKYKIIIPTEESKQETERERVCNCGLKESEHNVRHPFIPRLEPKQETLEEAAERYAESNQYDLECHDEGGYLGIDTKIFAKKLIDFTNKWFEQFKKK